MEGPIWCVLYTKRCRSFFLQQQTDLQIMTWVDIGNPLFLVFSWQRVCVSKQQESWCEWIGSNLPRWFEEVGRPIDVIFAQTILLTVSWTKKTKRVPVRNSHILPPTCLLRRHWGAKVLGNSMSLLPRFMWKGSSLADCEADRFHRVRLSYWYLTKVRVGILVLKCEPTDEMDVSCQKLDKMDCELAVDYLCYCQDQWFFF